MKTKQRSAHRLRPFEMILMLVMAAFLLSGIWATRTQAALADKVVRLHVLANSDAEADQKLKLQVRDAVLQEAEWLLEAAEDRTEAEAVLQNALDTLETAAATEIAARGYDYSVRVALEETTFPTREYEDFTLPAGKYLALRVIIGAGEGQNWWCVVFPPLCTAATSETSVAAMASGMTEEQVRLITEENTGYVLKFKSIELWEALKEKLA